MRSMIALLAGLAIATAAAAEEGFTATLTTDERAAAGLDKLTPGELARLQVLIERYKSGEVIVIREEAQAKVASAEAKAREAATATERTQPGWLKALVTLQRAGEKPEAQEVFETRLATEFRGWREHTVFTLENGQQWRVDGTEPYITPPQPAPRVRIRPGVFGSYWMEIEGVRTRVKVRPHVL